MFIPDPPACPPPLALPPPAQDALSVVHNAVDSSPEPHEAPIEEPSAEEPPKDDEAPPGPYEAQAGDVLRPARCQLLRNHRERFQPLHVVTIPCRNPAKPPVIQQGAKLCGTTKGDVVATTHNRFQQFDFIQRPFVKTSRIKRR